MTGASSLKISSKSNFLAEAALPFGQFSPDKARSNARSISGKMAASSGSCIRSDAAPVSGLGAEGANGRICGAAGERFPMGRGAIVPAGTSAANNSSLFPVVGAAPPDGRSTGSAATVPLSTMANTSARPSGGAGAGGSGLPPPPSTSSKSSMGFGSE